MIPLATGMHGLILWAGFVGAWLLFAGPVDRFVLELPDEDCEALSSSMAKARGWMLVGAGGMLIAVKETFELVEGNEWEHWAFWVLVVLMAPLSLGHAAYQSAREGRALELRAAVRNGRNR